jgi:protein involved in polysaccharide export with SLBB domain
MSRRFLTLFLLVLALLPSAASAQWYSGSEKAPPAQSKQPPAAAAELQEAYKLGPGDKLRVTVYNEPDLSGEFEVGANGRVALPLIGEVSAHKKTLSELEKIVAARFSDGYLIEPRVSIQVLNFRHFYIMGEVKNPGSYPYVNALNVLNAVALAGGYTYRAKDKDMEILRPMPDGTTQEIEADENTRVMPEDTIKIKERFF